ncbi:hypothetical protein J3R82DRAFT_8503 [Butyriboletus roseoflavus]|nr:hypothetical protein J3R82DRAFT_8503 [Butyriboletus roseoflavus]
MSQPHWNGVLATRVCGPYILCFSNHSIDAYPIPLQFLKPEHATEPPLPVLRRVFAGTGFSGNMSLSHVRCSRSSSGDTYSICALAEHQTFEMFHYLIYLQTTPQPSLSVRVLASDSALTHRQRPQVSCMELGSDRTPRRAGPETQLEPAHCRVHHPPVSVPS